MRTTRRVERGSPLRRQGGEQQGSMGRRERDGAGDGDREQESPERDDARRRMANAGCAHDVGRQSQELSCRVHEQKEDNERANDARRQELRRRRCKEGVRLWPCPEDERGRRAPTCRPDAFWGPAARARTMDFPGTSRAKPGMLSPVPECTHRRISPSRIRRPGAAVLGTSPTLLQVPEAHSG